MNNNHNFNRTVLEENFGSTRQRLEENRYLLDEKAGEIDQRRAYAIFEDALAAAGLARALNRPTPQIRKYLTEAARAAMLLFQWRGSLNSAITHLPRGEEEHFVDTSATNPWTYVRAVYAALTAGATENLDYLASLSPLDFHSSLVTVSPLLDKYSILLNRIVADAPREAQNLLHDIPLHEHNLSLDDLYWLVQAKALDRLVERDSAGFQATLSEVEAVIEQYYDSKAEKNNPERFLSLPVLGLRALANRLSVNS